ncbi:hypothetical protein OUZ56_015472 [Daphnia magna]|uniref:Uncharacterized protein n=1 Tax=Daphnia magna TaxID=35525 RepID=A0ABR0AMZ1_9CRUS|nr:hypothetical protein OUZ56_015472 [Daphnia magna]
MVKSKLCKFEMISEAIWNATDKRNAKVSRSLLLLFKCQRPVRLHAIGFKRHVEQFSRFVLIAVAPLFFGHVAMSYTSTFDSRHSR